MNKFKNRLKKMSKESKAGILVGLCSVIFLASVTTVGILVKNNDKSVQTISAPLSVVIPSSGENKDNSSVEEPVVSIQDSVLQQPFNDEEVGIIRYYFDHTLPDDDPTLEKAVYFENNRYISSVGLDYATHDDKPFDVLASAPGTIKAITPNDKTFGNIVIIKHDDTGLETLYASLDTIQVKVGQTVKAGDRIGTSGLSSINKDYNHSLHYEVLKDGVNINPIKLFGQKLKSI